MPRVLLLLPSATYRAADFLEAAEALGAEVVVASERRQALAGAMGDRAIRLPLSRPEEAADAIAGLAARRPLDAIVAVDDQGVVAAALAGERLGLPHNPPEAAARSRDKAAMRAALAAAGIPQPDHRVVGPGDDVAGPAGEVGFPCVVKPVSLSASRGVIRADDPASAVAAAARVRWIVAREDPDAPLLVERFVPGPEVALEGLLRSGTLEVLALFDKPDPMEGPFFEETIYVTPARIEPEAAARVGEVAARAARALGLAEGPVHAELRLTPDGPVVLELAARSIGGLCSRALRFGAGVRLEELILRHALGAPLEGIERERAASGVMMLPIPRAGVLREVRGREAALSVPGVGGLEITIHPGRPVVPLPEGDRYLGFLFARADTPDRVEAALREAHARLEVVIEEGSPAEAAPGPGGDDDEEAC
ncbi:MAG: ATP-grasp domain-containing protein [Actinobacteria bacterium]|nr:ATP-grasp domain-containing protein [Actinomycetota bacterium]